MLAVVLAFLLVPVPLAAQAPPFETRKVADNVYVFRFGGHQSMFVVTPDGVIATDAIGYLRPQAVKTYIDEIRKVSQAPIKYVIYSHHHSDNTLVMLLPKEKLLFTVDFIPIEGTG